MKTAILALMTLVLSFALSAGLVFAQDASSSPSPSPTTAPLPSGAPNTGHAQ